MYITASIGRFFIQGGLKSGQNKRNIQLYIDL